MQVETAQHFDKPLVHKTVRHDDQYPPRTAAQELLVQDQTGFDGLAEADFVGEQYARVMARGYFRGDIELMWQQLHARAQQAERRGLGMTVAVFERAEAQQETRVLIDLTGEQTVQRPAELDETIEIEFRDDCGFAIDGDAAIN
jgi:hypothetical protein